MPEFDEYVDTRVAAAVLLTAAVLSPTGRRWLRRGAVYGTAGFLMARDALSGFGKGITRGFRDTVGGSANGMAGVGEEAREAASGGSV